MTALILSLLLVAYIVIPGIMVRRIVSLFVPLRRVQWNRTEELTSAVVGSIIPFCMAFAVVKLSFWFGHHPFPFDDSASLRWSDYKAIFSASYSEKLYEHFLDTNNDAFWQSVLRVAKRQSRIVIWFYVASALQATIAGLVSYYYGDLKKYHLFESIAWKIMIPNISEWHVMLTPFIFPRRPRRTVCVDILTPEEKLYRGTVGDYHIDSSSRLTGILLKNACRFDRKSYISDKEKGDPRPNDSYWKSIDGHNLYILADKIHNLNISFPPDQPLTELAENSLKKMNISAHVSIEVPRIPGVEKKSSLQSSPNRDFSICPHCHLHINPAHGPRYGENLPLVSRSDGRSYHIFLLHGPAPRAKARVGGNFETPFIVHFRYALDQRKIENDPVSVIVWIRKGQEKEVSRMVELVADKLEEELEKGNALMLVYSFREGSLTQVASK